MGKTAKKSRGKSKAKPSEAAAAHALHASHGDGHLVGIGNLRVVLCDDGNSWFAQGLEIDYAAVGTSEADVKSRFETGLSATIEEHLKRFRSIERLLVPAPTDVWREVLVAQAVHRTRFSQVSFHRIEDVSPRAADPAPSWCKIRPKAEPDAPDLAPVIAHLRAEAERSRAESSRLGSVPTGIAGSAARRCASRASALERAAEILSRHV